MDKTTSLQHRHSMQLPASAKQVLEWCSLDDAKASVASGELREALACLVLGDGTNLVFLSDFPGTIILNRMMGCRVVDKNDEYVTVEVGAGESWHELVMWCNDRGYSGIENLALIPGRVGAAPVQNIGAYGVEFSDVCESVSVIDRHTGAEKVLTKEECDFSYRHSCFKTQACSQYVITSVRLCLRHCHHQWFLRYKPLKEAFSSLEQNQLTGAMISDAIIAIRQSKLPDPKHLANAGSFFKNPYVSPEHLDRLLEDDPLLPFFKQNDRIKLSAGYLIESCGFKGVSQHGIGTYEKHALVIVHHGGADGRACWEFVQAIRRAVLDRFEVLLELEVRCYHQAKLMLPSCAVDTDLA